MILLSLVVDTIELGKGGLEAWNLAITEEAPDLTQGHRERFL
jgi:hypothetical protein